MRRIRVPKARATDPETSWEAARSISRDRLRQSQVQVLTMFEVYGDMTDEELLRALWKQDIAMSDSGARTRRKELVDGGYLRDSGRRGKTKSGRRTVIWEVSDEGD